LAFPVSAMSIARRGHIDPARPMSPGKAYLLSTARQTCTNWVYPTNAVCNTTHKRRVQAIPAIAWTQLRQNLRNLWHLKKIQLY